MNNNIQEALKIINELEISDDGKWIEGYKKHSIWRLDAELEYVISNISRSSTVLEYGSAPFIFTKALALSNYHVVGTDIAPERFDNFEKLNLDVRKVNYDLESLPIDSDSIDDIICNEVFEHMRGNLIKTYNEAYRILKKNGKIHISTPNLRSIKGIYMFLIKNKSCSCACDLYHEWSKIEKFGHMGHVREYTSTEVIDFLEKVGFKVEKIIYTGKTKRKAKGDYKSIVFNFIEKLFPSLRPDMKIIASK